MCLAQGPQRSDAGEARTRDPSVSSQALYHWATALQVLRRYDIWQAFYNVWIVHGLFLWSLTWKGITHFYTIIAAKTHQYVQNVYLFV